jgi:hypothetical protein
MRRREIIKLLAGATVAWSRASYAQQSERLRRIGVLTSSNIGDPDRQAS